MKKSLLLFLSLFLFSSNVRSMESVVEADASKLLGGAKSSAELQGRVDMYFDQFKTLGGECHKEPDSYINKPMCAATGMGSFSSPAKRQQFKPKESCWFSWFGWRGIGCKEEPVKRPDVNVLPSLKGVVTCTEGEKIIVPGKEVCTPKETVQISDGMVDVKIREVDASIAQTQASIDALTKDSRISDAAKASAISELEMRKEFLSEVRECHAQLKGDLEKATQMVSVNAKDLDRIAKQDKLSAHDISVVKTVNDAMKAPFERAQKCYSHVVTGDALARSQADLGEEMVKDGANSYAESQRYAEKLSSDLDRKVEIKRAELKRQELEARCKATGDSLDCWWETTKLAASDTWLGAKVRASDASEWVCDGWGVVDQKLKARYQEREWLTRQYESVRDFGVCDGDTCTASPSAYYGIQAGKVVGGAAAALVGAYAAYKLIKFGWNHGGSRLYNALWGNRSKKARVAMFMALGAAVAVAPSTAMHYGLMQP